MKDKEKANVSTKEEVERRNKIRKEKSELKQALLHYATAEAGGGIKSLIDCEGCAFYLYEILGYRKLPKDAKVFIPDGQMVLLTRKEYDELLARPLNVMGELAISKIKNKKCKYFKEIGYGYRQSNQCYAQKCAPEVECRGDINRCSKYPKVTEE